MSAREAAGVRRDRDPRALRLGDGTALLKDVLDAMGEHVDALKFAGGSFTLMPETALRELIEIAQEHDMLLSTGTNRARLAPDGAACLSKPRSKVASGRPRASLMRRIGGASLKETLLKLQLLVPSAHGVPRVRDYRL
jgi:hypothetical protein